MLQNFSAKSEIDRVIFKAEVGGIALNALNSFMNYVRHDKVKCKYLFEPIR